MPTRFTLQALPTTYTISTRRVNSPWVVSNPSSLPYRYSDTRVTGDNVKDWRVRIARGQSATTSLDGTRRSFKHVIGQSLTITCTPAYLGITSGVAIDGNHSAATGGGYPSVSSGIDAEADDKSRSKLLAHYLDATRKFSGASFTAELRETIEMFKHPYERVFRSSVDLSKTMVKYSSRASTAAKTVARLRKDLGEMWLTWRFGIKPTISDMNDAAEAVNGKWSGSSTVPLRGFGRSQTCTINPRLFYSNWSGGSAPIPPCYCEERVDTTKTVRYKGAIRVNGDANLHLQRFGFDLLDLPGGVWEGTPWSWLVDYFLNVQEVLDGMRFRFADVAWMNRTVRNAQTINRYNIRSEIPGCLVSAPGKPYYALATAVSRVPMASVPYPRFHFQIPGLTSLRWLNIAAVTQQFEAVNSKLKKLHI